MEVLKRMTLLLYVVLCLFLTSSEGDDEIFHNKEERENWTDDCIDTVINEMSSTHHQESSNDSLSCHRPYNFDTPCYLTSYCIEANGASWTAHDVCEAIARITVPMTQRMMDLGSCARDEVNIISGDVMYREKQRDAITRESVTKHRRFHMQVRQSWWAYFSTFVQLLTNTFVTMPKRIHLMVNVETCNRPCAWALANATTTTSRPTEQPRPTPVLSKWDILREKQLWKNECPRHILEEWKNWKNTRSVSLPSGCELSHDNPCFLSAHCMEDAGERWTPAKICQVVAEASHKLTQQWLEVDSHGCLDEVKNDFITDAWYTEHVNGSHRRDSRSVGRHYEWTVQNVRWDFYSAILSFILNAFISEPNNFHIDMQISTCNRSCAWGSPPSNTTPVPETPATDDNTTDLEIGMNWQPYCDGRIDAIHVTQIIFDNCYKVGENVQALEPMWGDSGYTCERRSIYCKNNTLQGDIMEEPALCQTLMAGLIEVMDFSSNKISCQDPDRINITFSLVANGVEIPQFLESVSNFSQTSHIPRRIMSILAQCNTPGVTGLTLTATIDQCLKCFVYPTQGSNATQETSQTETPQLPTTTTVQSTASVTEVPKNLWEIWNREMSRQPVCKDQNITYDAFIGRSFKNGWPSRCTLMVNTHLVCEQVIVICRRKRENFWPAADLCHAVTWATFQLAQYLSASRHCNDENSVISLHIIKKDRKWSRAVIAEEVTPKVHETTLDALTTYITPYFNTEQTYNLRRFRLKAYRISCRQCPHHYEITSGGRANNSEHLIRECHRLFGLQDITENRQELLNRGCTVAVQMLLCLEPMFFPDPSGFGTVPYIDTIYRTLAKVCPRKLGEIVYDHNNFD